MSHFDKLETMKEGKITLSQKQLKTFTVIHRFIDKSISRQQAAELLGLSTRQISRLKKGVLASGAQALIHKNTGRKPTHVLPVMHRNRTCVSFKTHLGKMYHEAGISDFWTDVNQGDIPPNQAK